MFSKLFTSKFGLTSVYLVIENTVLVLQYLIYTNSFWCNFFFFDCIFYVYSHHVLLIMQMMTMILKDYYLRKTPLQVELRVIYPIQRIQRNFGNHSLHHQLRSQSKLIMVMFHERSINPIWSKMILKTSMKPSLKKCLMLSQSHQKQ